MSPDDLLAKVEQLVQEHAPAKAMCENCGSVFVTADPHECDPENRTHDAAAQALRMQFLLGPVDRRGRAKGYSIR